MKTCTACGLTKPETDFHWQNKAQGKRHPKCKPCNCLHVVNHRAANRERYNERERIYYHRNMEDPEWARKEHLRNVKRRKDRPDRQHWANVRSRLKHDFGLAIQDYWRMLAQVGAKCEMCSRFHHEVTNGLGVDHCHKTGQIRGVLCVSCNRRLGIVENGRSMQGINAEFVVRANNYLENSSQKYSEMYVS